MNASLGDRTLPRRGMMAASQIPEYLLAGRSIWDMRKLEILAHPSPSLLGMGALLLSQSTIRQPEHSPKKKAWFPGQPVPQEQGS